MKCVLLVVLSLKEIKFREVNYLATVDEVHSLFIYIYFMYVYMYVCVCVFPLFFKNNLKLFYKPEYNIVR